MRTLVCVILVGMLLFSCKKEVKELRRDDSAIKDTGLIISYGVYRGWCAGDDSLTITANDLCYLLIAKCGESEISKHKSITPDIKSNLLNLLDFETFKKLQLNSCNICFDGSDYWISIKNNSYYHRIRYGAGDSTAISSMKLFVKELDRLKAEFE